MTQEEVNVILISILTPEYLWACLWTIPCHSSLSLQVRREAVPPDTGVKVRQVPGAKDSGEQRPGACRQHPTFHDRHHPGGGHPTSSPRRPCAGHWGILL